MTEGFSSYRRSFLALLGDIADRLRERGRYYSLEQNLREARMPVTYRTYLAYTYLYVILVSVSALVSFYTVAYFLNALDSLVAFAGLVASLLGGYTVHELRVYYPKYVSDVREQKIDTSLSGVASFMFALTRGGVPLPDVLRTVGNQSDVFGEAAEEIAVASRHVDYFGGDVVTALQDLSDDTPSDEMADFLKGFVSIVVRREDLSEYLETRASDFYETAEEKQQNLLEQLGLLAEFYVVVFVAAPLFLITILVVMGFVGDTTLVSLRAVVYVLIPLTAVGYIILLDVLFESPAVRSRSFRVAEAEFIHGIPTEEESRREDAI
ncbi:MAG: type II secretion system F family protein, partial [Halobacteria archaeon]|nr:type II secretion system F family protein [Halobacteria archaeon]